MKKQNSQKGVLLLCTLIIMVILSVALMVGVWRMNSSVSTTKRAIWDIKSYWATKAGNTIAADGCLRSREWPKKELLSSFANYEVKHEKNNVIKGEDTTCDGSFSIYYINHLYNNRDKNFSSDNVAEVSLQPIFEEMQFKYKIKDEIYLNKKTSYDSTLVAYKEAVIEYKQAVAEYKTALANNSDIEKKEKKMLVKKSNMITALSMMQNARDAMSRCLTQELYTLTVGKSGPYIAGMELVYAINPTISSDQNGIVQDSMSSQQSVSASAATFVTGKIDITTNKILQVNQSNGSRPCMIAKEVVINNGGTEPTPDGPVAINIGNGTIFTDKCTINHKDINPGYTNSNLLKYGINVFPIDKINLEVAKVKEENSNIQYPLPSGTFCFIQMPAKYTEEEFEATCSSIKELYFNPDDFYDVYISDQDNVVGSVISVVAKVLDIATFGSVKNDSINLDYCDIPSSKAYEIFNRYFAEPIQDLGSKCSSPIIKPDAKKYYRNYLLAHLNSLMESYAINAEDYYGDYEPFFIPDGYLGISGKLDYKNWEDFRQALMTGSSNSFYFSYQNLTKSRIYSDFADSIDQHSGISVDNTRLATLFKGIFGLGSIDEEEEKEKLKKHFQNEDFQKKYKNYYICKKIQTKDNGGYLNVMEKLPDYQFGIDDSSCKFPRYIAKKLSFTSNKNELTMTISDQFKSKNLITEEDGFFNFATFERTGNYSYGTAKDRRAGLEFDRQNSASSLTATSIDIKGTVGGTGSLRTTTGDIIFEAIGSGIDQKENYVALLSGRDITLKRVSATNLTWNAEDESDNIENQRNYCTYRGVFHSLGDLKIEGDGINRFSLRGTIICGGDMTVTGIDDFIITYDPNLSSIMLNYINGWNDTFEYMEEILDKQEELEQHNENPITTGTFKYFNRI